MTFLIIMVKRGTKVEDLCIVVLLSHKMSSDVYLDDDT